jgi:hypothetical protein
MHPFITKLTRIAAAGSLALTALTTVGCYGEVYAGGDPASYPSDGFVATAEPVYFDGQPTYYYGGRWYYRNGGRWNYYRSEPTYLRQYRGAHPTVVRGAARGGVRGGVRAGGGRGIVRGRR